MLGAPIALQDALINVSFLIITVIVNQMGVIASASWVLLRKSSCLLCCPMAISSAVATMTAQNYGAGLIKRMNKCLASGDWDCSCFRCVGLRVFAIPAGDSYCFLYERCCCGGNGGQIICEGIASTAS